MCKIAFLQLIILISWLYIIENNFKEYPPLLDIYRRSV